MLALQRIQGFTVASATLWGNTTEPGIFEKVSSKKDRSLILDIWDVEPFSRQAGERQVTDISSIFSSSFYHFKIYPVLYPGSSIPRIYPPSIGSEKPMMVPQIGHQYKGFLLRT